MRQDLETVYLPGLTANELTEVGTWPKTFLSAAGGDRRLGGHHLAARAAGTLNAFNTTMRDLLDGRSQVMLEVRLIQLAHTSMRNTGIQPPQSMTAFNVYAEEQSILNANQSLVQQIISSGLASPNDTLAILGILVAAGDVPGALFQNGLALFGGGLTQSALAPGAMTLNFALNSSDSRELDQIQMRLGDGEEGTLKEGSKYPIQTSSYSSVSGSVPNIPGLTGVGSSSSLTSLLASLGGSSLPIPMIQYQDLGLNLKGPPSDARRRCLALDRYDDRRAFGVERRRQSDSQQRGLLRSSHAEARPSRGSSERVEPIGKPGHQRNPGSGGDTGDERPGGQR